MNFITKRQKFATDQRQKQRQQIFRKHRSNYSVQQPQSTNSNAQGIKNNGFIFHAQISSIGLTTDAIEQRLLNGQLEKIFQSIPKWIASLSQLIPNSTDLSSVFHQLLNISFYCLAQKKLILQVTSCLAQLTSLPINFLKSLGIVEEQLAQQITVPVYKILQESSDMQIILNCVYISGNLYQSFRSLQANQNFTNEQNVSQGQIYEMQLGIVSKMMQICSKYPNYQNCLEVMLWYMKNSLILSNISKNKNINQFQNNTVSFMSQGQEKSIDVKRQIEFIYILEKIILFISCKFSQSNRGGNDQYYSKILEQSFYLLSIIVSDPHLYYIEVGSTSSKKMYQGKRHLPQIIYSIDLSIQAFLSNLQNHWQISTPVHKTNKKRQSLSLISQILEQMLQLLIKVPNFHVVLPKNIPTLCCLVAEGRIKCAQGVSLCLKTLEICLNTNVPDLYRLGKNIVKKYMQNILKIVGQKSIIEDRRYRLLVMQMLKQMQDLLSYSDIRDIVNEIISSQGKNKQMREQLTAAYKNILHAKYEQYMISTALLPILNIIELLLIDEDSEYRVMGLKIIYKLTTNWEIDTIVFRTLVLTMGLGSRILEMQDEKEESVYSAALDLIQQLQLDEECF